MLKKVISGGQTGADIAGLMAAQQCGLETGGMMTKGWRTQDGPRPGYAEEYGMAEMPTADYPARTRANVKDSDATIRFAGDFGSPGEICTKKAIDLYGRPYLDVRVTEPIDWDGDVDRVAKWIEENNVVTLNVAGNTEKTCPGISYCVFSFLESVFQRLGVPEE